MSRIPLAIGTLKERKERQAQADANLALEIANSKRLSRASRDYWVNGEEPINTQGDYTTAEILEDGNKLLKILSNDVKSLLDREQYALFVGDNTWNNLRYLKTVVSVFPMIKKNIQGRLNTAPQLLEIINTYVLNTDNDYTRGFNQNDGADNFDDADYPENADNNGDFDYEYNYNNYPRQQPIARNPIAYDNVAGRRVMVRNLFDNLPGNEADNDMGQIRRRPRRDYVPQEPDKQPDDPPPPYMSRADYIASQRPDDMESSSSSRIQKIMDATTVSVPENLTRQTSGDTVISDITNPEFNDLTPSVEIPREDVGRRISEETLARKIAQLSQLDEFQLVPLMSKLINIRINGKYMDDRGSKSYATRRANKIIMDEFNAIPNGPDKTENEVAIRNDIARDLAGTFVSEMYMSGLYDFPEPSRTGKQLDKMGFGIKGKSKTKKGTKYGKGMAFKQMEGVVSAPKPDRSELYYSFGVFAVHKKSLNDNILNLKYKSFSQVHKYPKRQISEDLKDILVDAIETKKINQKLFNALTDSDKHFLTELVSEAKLKDQFSNIFKTKVGDGIAVNENPLDRFEILKGQLIAGNSSPEIKKELRLLVQKFMKDGLIEKKDGFGILELL